MPGPAGKADTRNGKWNYERRRPEQTLLYRLVAEHYPRFLALLADQGRSVPHYVRREFDDFLKCGILEHGFLRVRCRDCKSERLAALVPKPRVNLTRFARIVLILARFAGPLKRSKYVPDAFFTGSSPPIAHCGNGLPRHAGANGT